MFGMDSNCYQLVRNALVGKKAIDEQAFAAIEILKERLERLKKMDKVFSNVGLSPFVRQLAKGQRKLPVG